MGGNQVAKPFCTVRKPVGDVQDASSADFHSLDTLIPAGNDISDPQRESKRLVPFTAAIEFPARGSVRVSQPARIMDLYKRRTLSRFSSGTDHFVTVFKTGRQSYQIHLLPHILSRGWKWKLQILPSCANYVRMRGKVFLCFLEIGIESIMAIGLIIIGDEIMSGKRSDQHFPNVVQILKERGLGLDWARYVGDEPERIVSVLRETFSGSDIVFCCGGIGSTPDDHTRQCASIALGKPLELHPEARIKIIERMVETAKDPSRVDVDSPDNVRRPKMGEYPAGSRIIPNPVNRIPGFSYGTHYFVPGFPQMAKAMISWALDTYHRPLFHQTEYAEKSVVVYGAVEAKMTPLMEKIEALCPAVRVFSLPHMGNTRLSNYVEMGVKGKPENLEQPFRMLIAGLDEIGAKYQLN